MMDPAALTAWLELGAKLGVGFTAAVCIAIWALYKGYVVWGWQCKGVEKERDEWKRAALDGTGRLEDRIARMEQRRL